MKTINPTKKDIQQLFRNYSRMTSELERKIRSYGFDVVHTKTHIKLYYNGRLAVCPTTPSDWREGRNLASKIWKCMSA